MNTVVSPDDGHIVTRNMYRKYTKNKLCTELALFTVLYRDARSTKDERRSEVHFIIKT